MKVVMRSHVPPLTKPWAGLQVAGTIVGGVVGGFIGTGVGLATGLVGAGLGLGITMIVYDVKEESEEFE